MARALLPPLLTELALYVTDAEGPDEAAEIGPLKESLTVEDVAGWLRHCNSALRTFQARAARAVAAAARAQKRLNSAALRTERPDVEQLLMQLELRDRQLQQAAARSRELEAHNSALRQQLGASPAGADGAGAHGGGPCCPAAAAQQAAADALAGQLQQLEELNEALWRRAEALRGPHAAAASTAAHVRGEMQAMLRGLSGGLDVGVGGTSPAILLCPARRSRCQQCLLAQRGDELHARPGRCRGCSASAHG
jgi:hypothetical protein